METNIVTNVFKKKSLQSTQAIPAELLPPRPLGRRHRPFCFEWSEK